MSDRIGGALRRHLRIYQLLGFHTLSLEAQVANGTGNLLCAWAVALCFAFSAVAFICLSSDDEYLYNGDRFGYFIDGLKYCAGELAIVSIYWESLWCREPLARFWHLYASMQKRVWGSAQKDIYGHYAHILYAMILGEFLTLLYFVCVQSYSHHLLLFWSTFQPFVCFTHMRNMQFVLHLSVLHQQLLQLEHELGLLAEYARFASLAATFTDFEGYLRRRVHQKQLEYARIYDLFTCFQNAFGYSMLAVLLMMYVRVLVDCYFMYYVIYQQFDNIDYILLMPAIMHIPVIIYTSQACMSTTKRIAYQLHCIVCHSQPLFLQIQNFSLQLLHQPICINCLGIVTVDGYLLTRIACSVATNMIFFIQFMPKFGNLYGS